jgi:hypothetical protein
VGLVRLFDGFDEGALVPLFKLGGVNVEVPTLGEVL